MPPRQHSCMCMRRTLRTGAFWYPAWIHLQRLCLDASYAWDLEWPIANAEQSVERSSSAPYLKLNGDRTCRENEDWKDCLANLMIFFVTTSTVEVLRSDECHSSYPIMVLQRMRIQTSKYLCACHIYSSMAFAGLYTVFVLWQNCMPVPGRRMVML